MIPADEVESGGSQGPSATWPGALKTARKKRPGHFGRDDRKSVQRCKGGKVKRFGYGRWRRKAADTVLHSAILFSLTTRRFLPLLFFET